MTYLIDVATFTTLILSILMIKILSFMQAIAKSQLIKLVETEI